MDTNTVDALLKSIVLEASVEDLPDPEGEPRPRSRFKWQPPLSRPKKDIPVPSTKREIPPGLLNALRATRPQLENPEDRIGKYSMRDLLPPEQVATPDDLLDLYSRIDSTRDPATKAALQRDFDAHKTEFESRLQQFVDALLS